MAASTNARELGLWLLSVALAALFLFAGLLSKLIWFAEAGAEFSSKYSYPAAFAILIGICETAGAVGLLIPRFAPLAAAGLSFIMVGAVVSHLRSGDPILVALFPVLILVLLGVVAVGRFDDMRRSHESSLPTQGSRAKPVTSYSGCLPNAPSWDLWRKLWPGRMSCHSQWC